MWDDVLLYVIIGFVAQMIDGAIGMAYGVTASSVLLGLGVPPATVSAWVHAAETFTTGASGHPGHPCVTSPASSATNGFPSPSLIAIGGSS